MSDAVLDVRAEPPALDLVIYPNPPLGRHGSLVLMAVVLLIGGLLGVGFATLGAWPVTGFIAVDIGLLGAALTQIHRHARRVEIVRLDRDGLTVRRLAPDGRAQSEVRLEPTWVRVAVDERRRHDPRVSLRSHGRTVPIATFLAPAERREVARELERAIAAFQRDPRRP